MAQLLINEASRNDRFYPNAADYIMNLSTPFRNVRKIELIYYSFINSLYQVNSKHNKIVFQFPQNATQFAPNLIVNNNNLFDLVIELDQLFYNIQTLSVALQTKLNDALTTAGRTERFTINYDINDLKLIFNENSGYVFRLNGSHPQFSIYPEILGLTHTFITNRSITDWVSVFKCPNTFNLAGFSEVCLSLNNLELDMTSYDAKMKAHFLMPLNLLPGQRQTGSVKTVKIFKQPITISQLHIQFLNKYNEIIEMNNPSYVILLQFS